MLHTHNVPLTTLPPFQIPCCVLKARLVSPRILHLRHHVSHCTPEKATVTTLTDGKGSKQKRRTADNVDATYVSNKRDRDTLLWRIDATFGTSGSGRENQLVRQSPLHGLETALETLSYRGRGEPHITHFWNRARYGVNGR